MEQTVAALTVVMVAIDGRISRRATEGIMLRFYNRAEIRDAANEGKDDVVRCMKDTMAPLQRSNTTKFLISSYRKVL